MFTPRRTLASLLVAGAVATGLAACGDNSDSEQIQKSADHLQQQGTQLQIDAQKAAQDVKDGTKSSEDAAAEIQAGAEKLTDEAKDTASDAIDAVKDNANVPDSAKQQLEQAQDQLNATP